MKTNRIIWRSFPPGSTLVCRWLIIILGLAASLVLGQAADLALPEVPASLPSDLRQALLDQRAQLLMRWANYQRSKAELLREYGPQIDIKDERAEAATRLKKSLEREHDSIVDDADNFIESLPKARMDALQRQIDEIKRKLPGLGFDARVAEFEELGVVSSEAAAALKRKLISRALELITSAAQGAFQERFLGAIQDLKPALVKETIADLQRAGVRDQFLIQWLRAFTPTKPRAQLIEEARKVVEHIQEAKELFEVAEGGDPKTIEARQKVAVTLFSLVLPHHPYAGVLVAVAGGIYDVGEAWFYQIILEKDTGSLLALTDAQLVQLRPLLKRMEQLVRERNAAREEWRRLTSGR